MFESNELVFFKLEEDDLEDLLRLKQESWETTHNVTIANRDDQDRWFASLDRNVHSPRSLVLVACKSRAKEDGVKRTSGTKVGIFKITNVDYISRTADTAWDIFEDWRGKGFGKKIVAGGSHFCFGILNLRRLTAEILSINEPSAKCASAAGYVHEGTKRQLTHKNGEFLDSQVWGLLNSEFLGVKPN
jgi:RimJ/RimL family protein N-acetyltransferase